MSARLNRHLQNVRGPPVPAAFVRGTPTASAGPYSAEDHAFIRMLSYAEQLRDVHAILQGARGEAAVTGIRQ